MTMTYREALENGCKRLTDGGIPDPMIDAELFLMHVCRCGRNERFMNPGRILTDEEEGRFLEFLDKRCKRIPLQHLTGVQNFMGMDFKVSPAVLIPRADTEILVEEVMKDGAVGASILDMCTGSGCIILSLVKYVSGARGMGADISGDALAVAKENGSLLGLDAEFIQSDLYENIDDSFDIIVSNPPYLTAEEMASLQTEVAHEPALALDGGSDGLDIIRDITKIWKKHLKKGGWLCYEFGDAQHEQVGTILAGNGFDNITFCRDFSGIVRTVAAQKTEE